MEKNGNFLVNEYTSDFQYEPPKSFEDLWIWRQARELVKEVYRDFGAGEPGNRDFAFRDHIQKTGISVKNNIAEGFERGSNREFIRFLNISKGSCGELRSMYYSAEDLRYVSPECAHQRRVRAKKISSGIASLIDYLKKY